MQTLKLHRTVGVRVGRVQVGGGAPVVVQSMTSTDTTDVGRDRPAVRWNWRRPAPSWSASRSTRRRRRRPSPEIRARLDDRGCDVPLIGDFHYNGHLLLTRYPACAAALDKYRINPGNVGTGARRDEQFATICQVARDHGKPVRIGVNGGSLNQDLVLRMMQENTDRDLGKTSEDIINECMVISALESTELALECGPAQGPDHHLVQGVASAQPRRACIASCRARPTSRCTSASPRPAWA